MFELWGQLVDAICRPPRDSEFTKGDLIGGELGRFKVSGFNGRREDLTLVNKQGLKIECSHFIPSDAKGKDGKLPCVIYCHCNSGSRRDAEEAVYILIPLGVSVFTLDFAGSGLSEGQYVTLGAHEADDIEVVVAHLRRTDKVSTLGLWGRSMGAVTTLLYSNRDPSIAGIVVDSPFCKLTQLMLEVVEQQKLPVPRALLKVALAAMKRSVRKKAGFDLDKVAPVEVVSQSFIPALFAHAHGDAFIKISHSETIHAAYAGDKNFIKFDGDHNSRRPKFFFSSVSVFFHNTLQLDQVLEGGNRLERELLTALGDAGPAEAASRASVLRQSDFSSGTLNSWGMQARAGLSATVKRNPGSNLVPAQEVETEDMELQRAIQLSLMEVALGQDAPDGETAAASLMTTRDAQQHQLDTHSSDTVLQAHITGASPTSATTLPSLPLSTQPKVGASVNASLEPTYLRSLHAEKGKIPDARFNRGSIRLSTGPGHENMVNHEMRPSTSWEEQDMLQRAIMMSLTKESPAAPSSVPGVADEDAHLLGAERAALPIISPASHTRKKGDTGLATHLPTASNSGLPSQDPDTSDIEAGPQRVYSYVDQLCEELGAAFSPKASDKQ